MKTLKLLALAVTLMFGAAALADIEEKREMKIVIEGVSSDDSTSFHWSSNDSSLDMHNMQIGESQSIVDESGRSVLITRESAGFRFDIDGETIVVPDMDFGPHEMHMAFTDGSDFTTDINVEVMGDVMGKHQFMSAHASDGVTIISGEALDATTKESIKAVLLSAGRNDEVIFIDGSGDADRKHIKIIRKQIEVIHE
jgi:hypothetical protein